jgi:hypothetical protein
VHLLRQRLVGGAQRLPAAVGILLVLFGNSVIRS